MAPEILRTTAPDFNMVAEPSAREDPLRAEIAELRAALAASSGENTLLKARVDTGQTWDDGGTAAGRNCSASGRETGPNAGGAPLLTLQAENAASQQKIALLTCRGPRDHTVKES